MVQKNKVISEHKEQEESIKKSENNRKVKKHCTTQNTIRNIVCNIIIIKNHNKQLQNLFFASQSIRDASLCLPHGHP